MFVNLAVLKKNTIRRYRLVWPSGVSVDAIPIQAVHHRADLINSCDCHVYNPDDETRLLRS